jgi:hypothetical protein
MPEFAVHIAASADQLPAWPAGPPFYGLPWLRFYERAIAQEPRYLLVTRDSEPAASAICALNAYLYIPGLSGALRRVVQRFFTPRVLVCEVPAMEQPGIWLHPAHGARAAPVLAQALLDLAAAERRPLVLVEYLTAELHAARAAWPGYVGQPWYEDDSCLHLQAATLEAWIAGLERPKARKRLRQMPARLRHAGMTVETIAPGAARAAELYPLVQAVHAHHDEPGSAWLPEAFDALALAPAASVTIVRQGARAVACEALLVDRQDAAMKLFGLDYTADYRDFDTLTTFSHLPELFERGVQRLWMGTTRVEKKISHFGAVRVPRYHRASGRGPYAWLLRAAGMRAA